MAIVGLSTLMEAVSDLPDRDITFDPIFEAAAELVDDEVKQHFIEDSVEADMAGDGISSDDEKRYESILKKIPSYNEGIGDEIDALTESLIPEFLDEIVV